MINRNSVALVNRFRFPVSGFRIGKPIFAFLRLLLTRKLPLPIFTAFILLFLAGPAAGTDTPRITVAASILPLGDFARRVGGNRVEVATLIPPGASPHAFEPPPSVMAHATRARVLVYIGAGMEPWIDRVLLSHAGPVAAVDATRGIDLLQDGGHHHPEGDHEDDHKPKGRTPEAIHKHSRASGNPHIWLDPVIAQEISRQIAGALIQVDPAHKGVYTANLQKFLAELEDLHLEITRRVAAWTIKDYVCFHPAFIYFARRYGLREVGVIEMAPGREPTPKHLRNLIRDIRRYKIRVVFSEPQFSPRVAEVIAREAGVKVLMLDPVGGRPPYESDYLKLMKYNLDTMEKAMK
jgi:zinc transport system substrate-binding protein